MTAEPVAERILQFRYLRHHAERVLRLLLHLGLELLILHAHALDLVAELGDLVRGGAAAGPALALHAGALAVVVVGVRPGGRVVGAVADAAAAAQRGGAVGARVHAAQVLVEVLLAGEALAGVALAVWVRAVDRVLWSAVLVVDFALVAEETAGICKAGQVFASVGRAAIGTLVLVHVFAVRNMLATRVCANEIIRSGKGGGAAYFHSHFRRNARISSLQSSSGQWNLPSACLLTAREGLGIGFMRDEGSDSRPGEGSLLSGSAGDMSVDMGTSRGEGKSSAPRSSRVPSSS